MIFLPYYKKYFIFTIILAILGFAEGTDLKPQKSKLLEFVGKTFVYQDIMRIGLEKNLTRRDPSDVIKVGDSYYVWYTKVDQNKLPKRFRHLRTSGYVGTIYYAVSKDKGFSWAEKGQVLGIGKPGSFDSFAVFTPNIVKFHGRYYLYYTGVKPTGEGEFFFENNSINDFTAIGVAVADSPDGPFIRISEKPVLEVTPRSQTAGKQSPFDSYRIDDASLLIRDYDGDGDDDVWLYYKGRNIDQGKHGPSKTKMGLAIADDPAGPYKRLNNGDPICSASHEVMIWPHREGVAALASITGTFEYAPDGIDFISKPLAEKVKSRPNAPGCFRADLVKPVDFGKGIQWGISMKHGTFPYLIRYEIDVDVNERK